MPISPELLEILRCPIHPEGPPLLVKEEFLICQVDGGGYRVVEGIPHMLPEDEIPSDRLESEMAKERKAQ